MRTQGGYISVRFRRAGVVSVCLRVATRNRWRTSQIVIVLLACVATYRGFNEDGRTGRGRTYRIGKTLVSYCLHCLNYACIWLILRHHRGSVGVGRMQAGLGWVGQSLQSHSVHFLVRPDCHWY